VCVYVCQCVYAMCIYKITPLLKLLNQVYNT